uniref:Uncharacterized protein n=1 Tax=viral metagenome TaxID=1070528 RepID=A0A2V0R9X9_9ZZZZ
MTIKIYNPWKCDRPPDKTTKVCYNVKTQEFRVQPLNSNEPESDTVDTEDSDHDDERSVSEPAPFMLPTLKGIVQAIAAGVAIYRFGGAWSGAMSGWKDVGLFKPFLKTLKAYNKTGSLLSSEEWCPADQWLENAYQYTLPNSIGVPQLMQDIVSIAAPMNGIALDGIAAFVAASDKFVEWGEEARSLAESIAEFEVDLEDIMLPKLQEGGLYTEESRNTGGIGGSINWEAMLAPVWNSIAGAYNTLIESIAADTEEILGTVATFVKVGGDVLSVAGEAGEVVEEILTTETDDFEFQDTGNDEADAALDEVEEHLSNRPPAPGEWIIDAAEKVKDVIQGFFEF